MNPVMQASLMFVATVSLVTTGLMPAVGGEGTAIRPVVRVHEVPSSGGHNRPAARGKRLVYPEQIREAIHSFVLREIAGKAVDCQVALGEPQQPIAVPSGTWICRSAPLDRTSLSVGACFRFISP